MLRFASLGSGSSGNSALVFSESTCLLVDAGISARQLRLRMRDIGIDPNNLDGILITHEHGDHTRGLEVFCRKVEAPIYCNAITQEDLSCSLNSVPSWRIIEGAEPFLIGDISVCGFTVMHDAVDPMGFIFEKSGVSLGFVSDVGHVTEIMRSMLGGVTSLFLEANYDELLLQNDTRRPWPLKQRIASRHGHLSNAQAAEFITEIAANGVLQRVFLGHLSEDCNSPETAEAEVRSALQRKGIRGIEITCAERDQLSGPFVMNFSNEVESEVTEGEGYAQSEFTLFS